LFFNNSTSFAHSNFVCSATAQNLHCADSGKLCEWRLESILLRAQERWQLQNPLSTFTIAKISFYLHENSSEASLLTTIFL
jgi:hypothetical protein